MTTANKRRRSASKEWTSFKLRIAPLWPRSKPHFSLSLIAGAHRGGRSSGIPSPANGTAGIIPRPRENTLEKAARAVLEAERFMAPVIRKKCVIVPYGGDFVGPDLVNIDLTPGAGNGYRA